MEGTRTGARGLGRTAARLALALTLAAPQLAEGIASRQEEELPYLRPHPEAGYPDRPPAAPEDPVELVVYGEASYYHPSLHGRRTASGAIYRRTALTAAHRSLPFGTVLRVTNLENGRRVVVEVNDRGPFVDDRILDLSEKAAEELDMQETGVAEVRIEGIEGAEAAEAE